MNWNLQDKANAEKNQILGFGKTWRNQEAQKTTTGETTLGQKKKKARPSGPDTLDFMRKKLETDTKIKQEELT